MLAHERVAECPCGAAPDFPAHEETRARRHVCEAIGSEWRRLERIRVEHDRAVRDLARLEQYRRRRALRRRALRRENNFAAVAGTSAVCARAVDATPSRTTLPSSTVRTKFEAGTSLLKMGGRC